MASGDYGNLYIFDKKGSLLWQRNVDGGILSIHTSGDGTFTVVESNLGITIFDEHGNKKHTRPAYYATLSSDDSFVVGSNVSEDHDNLVFFDTQLNPILVEPIASTVGKISANNKQVVVGTRQQTELGNSGELYLFENNIANSVILPPLKQFQLGITPEEIACNDGFVLMLKSNNYPECVKPETKQKLTERGWSKDVIPSKLSLISTDSISDPIALEPNHHDSKNNSQAENIFSECQQDDECIIEHMQKISHTSDRQTVLDTIDDLIGIYDEADFYCHPIAHHLDEFLLGYVKGNITDAANHIDSRCASGILHGITENTITIQTLLNHKDIQDLDIIQPCQIIDQQIGHKAKVECIHGMGHSITKAYQYDVINAVQKCDAYKDYTERYMCQGGLFMENLNQHWENLGGQFDKNDSYYPCDKIDSDHATLCYRYQGLYFLKNNNFDYASSFEMCDKIKENDFLDYCYKGISDYMATKYFEDIDKTTEICMSLNQDRQPICVKGAIESLTRFVSDDMANDFCNKLPDNLKVKCFKRHGQLVADRY